MQRLFSRAVAIAAVGLVFAVVVGTAPAATPAPRLLAMYEPVMHFDPLEKFRPASVQSFIADSDLERLTAPNTWSLVDSAPEPGDLPAAGTGTGLPDSLKDRTLTMAKDDAPLENRFLDLEGSKELLTKAPC